MRCIIVLPLALVLGGCFSYSRVGFADAPQGGRVALDLTTRGAADQEERLGVGVETIEGRLVRQSGDSIELAVTRTRGRQGGWTQWSGERVVLAETAIATLRERKLSISKTALAGVATAAMVALTASTDLFGGGGGRGEGGPHGPPPVGGQ